MASPQTKRARHGSRLLGAAAALGLLATATFAAVACSDGGVPGGSGNDFTNDTRDAEVRAPANPDDGAAPMGEPDAYATGQPEAGYGEGGYASLSPEGAAYPGLAECTSCSCPAATSYCFGGAPVRNDRRTVRPQAAVDAGPACPMVDAGALGCTALPAGTTDCAALIDSLQTTYACYLVCTTDGTTLNVHCGGS